MNAKKPHGKGLSGFIFGLLLATLVIAGILFFLNKTNKQAFKQPTPQPAPKTEVLMPKDSSMVVPPLPEPDSEETVPLDTGASQPAPASHEAASAVPAPTKEKDALGDFIKEQQKQETVKQHETAPAPDSSAVAPVEKNTVKSEPAKAAPKPKADVKAEKKAASKPAPKVEKAPAAAEKTPAPSKVHKPTPEQILDSGNIEKARKEAAKAAAATPAAPKTSSNHGAQVILQMGSFGDRASADAQRAKLAMLGVSASVVQATANGKTVYRVQSARLSQADAGRLKNTLQQHGVDSFSRTIK